MGAMSRLRVEHFDDRAAQARYPKPHYPFMLQGARALCTVDFKRPAALAFGNESRACRMIGNIGGKNPTNRAI